MLDPDGLYAYESHIDPSSGNARTLVVTLGAFMDAGHMQRLVNDHLRNSLPHHVLARFDADQLIDHRGQRSTIVFDVDHFRDYQQPEIVLHHLLDETGQPFLLLSGPEPDLQWERMAAAIERIVTTFGVKTTVMLQSIPMGVPHTRPVGITRHATDPSLLPGNQPTFGTVQMGASFPSMLEVRLGERGHDAIGLATHVPHYLAQTDFPDAAVAVLHALSEVSGLHLPTRALAVAAGVVRAQIQAQLEGAEEVSAIVTALEEQYDDFAAGRRTLDPPTQTDVDVPSADEIGAEAEQFLKGLSEGGDDLGA